MKRIGCIPFLLAVFFLLPGVGLLCGAKFYNTIWKAERDQCTDTTTAVVSEIVEKMDDSEDDGIMYLYQALVEYSVDDIKYSVEDRVSYGKENIPYSVGDRVTVHYNPDNPKKMYINEEQMSKVPKIFTIVGGVLTGVALLILILSACMSKKKYSADSNSDLTNY